MIGMKRIFTILFMLAATVCLGQEQRKIYTLQECLQEGIENNYSLKIQRNR